MIRRQHRRGILPATLAILAGAGLFTGASAAEPLITGTANYAIAMTAKGTARDGGMSGDMTYALKRECDAYRIEASLDLTIAGPAGDMPMKMRSILIERETALDFDLSGDLGGMIIEKAKGTATKTDAGLAIAVTEPAAKTWNVPGPVLFPVAMVEEAIRVAEAGGTFAEHKVFDGSGNGEEVWTMSLVITPVAESADLGEEALFATGLGFEDLDRWRMKFSYFKPGAGDQMPAFATEAIVYANGFALATTYDLGPVALHLQLIDFTPEAPKPCT